MARGKVQVSVHPPWWLDEGSELCSSCRLTYSYELDYRCVDCDAPLCPFCVVVEPEEVFCTSCRGGGSTARHKDP